MVNSYKNTIQNLFDLLLTAYGEMSGKCFDIQKNFKKSLKFFCKKYKISFTVPSLFRDIFWNLVFHNQILGCKFIFDYLNLEYENKPKPTLISVVQLLLSIKDPIKRGVTKLLKLQDILEDTDDIDLIEEILDKIQKNDKLREIKDIEMITREQIFQSKNPIKIIENETEECQKDESDNEDIHLNSISSYKKRIFYIDNDDENKETKNIFSEMKKDDIDSITIIHEKIIASNIKTESGNSKDLKDEEQKKLDKNNIINNIDDIKKLDKITEENNDKINMENKTLDEIYEYINKDNYKKKKNKKKVNKNKNKVKTESENKDNNGTINNSLTSQEMNNDYNYQNYEDPIVSKFKNDLCEKVIFAGSINKIRPVISSEWIRYISSY